MNARLSLPQLPTQDFLDLFEKRFIGFDRVLKTLTRPSFLVENNYPPYDIVTTGDYTYDIQLALAGFGKDDIIVEYKENQLTVKSKPNKEPADEVEKYDDGVQHRGISKRMFTRTFTIANDVEVKGAELKNGLLIVSMERIIPDHKKAKTIEIK